MTEGLAFEPEDEPQHVVAQAGLASASAAASGQQEQDEPETEG